MNKIFIEQFKIKDVETWRSTARMTAMVAAVAVVLLCGVLLLNYFQNPIGEALESQSLVQMKLQSIANPDDGALKQKIRQLDLEVRTDFFQRKQFTYRCAWLLLGAVVIFLASMKLLMKLADEQPLPDESGLKRDDEALNSKWLFRLTGIVGLAVVGWAVVTMMPSERGLLWGEFRGPGGQGVSEFSNVPTEWNGTTGKNIFWKVPVLLPGESSPVIAGNRIFLTGADAHQREVYCYDTRTGIMLWRKAVGQTPKEMKEPFEDTGYAAPTPATDGQRVYAIFATGDVACFDLEGNELWTRALGVPNSMYGYASSLAMCDELLLIQYDQGEAEDGLSQMVAIDGRNGQVVWQKNRPVANSWASPVVVETGGGKQLLTLADPWVIAYNPQTGKELWKANCLSGDVAPSAVYADGLVYAITPGDTMVAIRPDGTGDVTETHIAWEVDDGVGETCSPLCYDGKIWVLTGEGLLTCFETDKGKQLWQKDLTVSFNASPTLVGDKIYLLDTEGEMIILEAGDAFKKIAQSPLGEPANACPVILDGRIYIRGKKNLYCIGKK